MRTKFRRQWGRLPARRTALAVEPLEPRDAPSATQYLISGPGAVTAGAAASITVEAVDNFDNIDPFYSGTIHFTSSDPQALLPADYTFTLADAGQHTFNVTAETAGAQTITGTDTANPPIRGTLNSTFVTPAAVSRFAVSGFPGTTTAGAVHSFTVTAEDAYGNIATGYAGSIRFFGTDPNALLPAPYTFSLLDAGQATFTAQLNTVGPESFGAADQLNPAIQGFESGIEVSPGATAGFLIGVPGSTAPGAPVSIIVKAVDAFGNATPTYLGTIHFTSSDPLAQLPADYHFVAGDTGEHTFTTLTLETPGPQAVNVADTFAAAVFGSAPVFVTSPGDRPAGLDLSLSSSEIAAGDSVTLDGRLPFAFVFPVAVTLDWGDGSLPTTLTLPAGTTTLTATHVYDKTSGQSGGAFTIQAIAGVPETEPLIGTIEITVDSADSSGLGVTMDDVFVHANIGGLVTLDGTYTATGDKTLTATVDFDDGGATQAVTLGADGTFTVSHAFTAEGVYDVTVTVDDGTDTASADTTVLIFPPQLQGGKFQPVPPGGSSSASGPGIRALANHGAGAPRPAVLTVGNYNNLPVGGFDFNSQRTNAYELRLANAETDDQLTVTFSLPSGYEYGDGVRLAFYDQQTQTFLPVRQDMLTANSVIVNESTDTVTLLLDGSSFPKVTDLHGTIFTVSVAVSDAVPDAVSVSSRVVGVSFVSTTSDVSESFSSAGVRTLTLSPSNDGGPSTAQAYLSGERQPDDGAVAIARVAAPRDPWAVAVEDLLAGATPGAAAEKGADSPAGNTLWPLTPEAVVPVWPLTIPQPKESSDQGQPSRPPTKDDFWSQPAPGRANNSAAGAMAVLALAPGLMLRKGTRRRSSRLPGENPSPRCPI
jgi:hypothetical protein